MEFLNAIIYKKEEYSLKEACDEFVSLYVLYDIPEVILNNFDSVNFIKENKHLMLEESTDKIIILSDYDFEDFDFVKGQ